MKSGRSLEGARVGANIVADSGGGGSGTRKSFWRSWRISHMYWFVLIVTASSQFQQVSCLFQQRSMEARNCSNFRHDEYPLITVRHGEKAFNKSFSIPEDKVLDHEMFFLKCVAPYPIEWISNNPSIDTITFQNQAPSGSPKPVTAHLHIYRSVSDILDRSTYRFIISTRVRYKKNQGFKDINGTCRSIVKPHCLTTSIVDLNPEVGIAMKIFDRFQQNQQKVSSSSSPPGSSGKVDVDIVGNNSESPFHSEEDCDYRIFYEDIVDSRLTFTCEQNDGTLSSIGFIHQCANAMTCLNLYRNSRLPSGCAQPARENFTCIDCKGRQLRLSQGVIGCGSEESHGRKLLFFFTSPPDQNFSAKLYFRMEDADPSEMMWLSEIPKEVSLGEQLTVTCNVSSYYFAGGTRLALKFEGSNKLTFIKAILKNTDGNQHGSTTGGMVYEATIPITSTSIEKVYCLAPVWNSFEWVNKSRELTVKEVISEDIIIAVSVTIFLTALLVAMMFGILWIRIGKKTGRLNILTASEIDEFRRCSVSEENKPIKLQNGYEMVYDTAYEIKRDRLLIDETAVLGHGHFGVVLKGVVKDLRSEVRINVAVKTLKTKVDVGSLKALLSELKILASIGKHSNIVNLIGACTKKMGKGEVYVCVEYCANGNLQNFLRQHRQTFRNQLENDVLVIETPIRKLSSSSENIMTIDLIKWAWETAKGMEFLGSKKVIHGDLATRNILLTADHVAKVSDFGLSRQLVDYYYVQKETGPMPWKWMSLESLAEMKFSVQSDAWSFGVCLWELFTLAEVPYSGCSWSAEFVETLALGHRLGKPKFATSEMYDLMRECWKAEFSSRPSFFAIRMFFEDILTQCTSQDYVQFNVSTNGADVAYSEIMQSQPLLQSPRIIIEEEGEDDVFE